MNRIDNRLDVIFELAIRKPGLGKTAMMKYLFLLQQVYRVPLGYNFEIYTYGPYSSEVMEDIDFAARKDIISIATEVYPTGHTGYNIKAKEYNNTTNFAASYKSHIEELIKLFGDKNAKDLELSATIIYLYISSKLNSWNCSKRAVAVDVHEIKPHFNIDTIEAEYERLHSNSIFERVS